MISLAIVNSSPFIALGRIGLMAKLGWSCQKPDKRALERNEEAIERWKRAKWPKIKKTPRGWAPISSSSTKAGSS